MAERRRRSGALEAGKPAAAEAVAPGVSGKRSRRPMERIRAARVRGSGKRHRETRRVSDGLRRTPSGDFVRWVRIRERPFYGARRGYAARLPGCSTRYEGLQSGHAPRTDDDVQPNYERLGGGEGLDMVDGLTCNPISP